MATSVAEWIARAEQQITEAVQVAVAESAKHAIALIRSEIPQKRVQTRRALGVRWRSKTEALVGLFFAKKYTRSVQTETHRNFRRVWALKRPVIQRMLIEVLNSKLQGD